MYMDDVYITRVFTTYNSESTDSLPSLRAACMPGFKCPAIDVVSKDAGGIEIRSALKSCRGIEV
jgi:hypothetical protein